jgi:CelD/BcsL family acetyltransferase involved in cellulose biosynthesis
MPATDQRMCASVTRASIRRGKRFKGVGLFSVAMGLRGELVVDTARLESLKREWDELAVQCSRPYCSPAWMLPWWRHMAPEGALLRVAASFDGERLVGLAPFWAQPRGPAPTRYRTLSAQTAEPQEILAAPDYVDEVAAVSAAVLAGASPRPAMLHFDRIAASSAWPERLRASWPGRRRPALQRSHPTPAPALRLEHENFESWLASKSGNFRQQIRRSRRRLEQSGGRFRISSGEELLRDMEAFTRLHNARWDHRGGSIALIGGTREMLLDVARELLPLERYRLWCLDLEGETISAHLFVAAGDEIAYWLGGFDDRFARDRPGLITLVAAIEDALERGERRVDLGPGAQDYKYRLANSEETHEFVTLVPPGIRQPLARGELAGRRIARTLLRR